MIAESIPAKLSVTARLLRNRNYLLSWPSGLSSQMGRLMWIFVCAYLVFDLSGSSFLTSLVAVTAVAPLFLLSVASGTLADAFDRRRLMQVSLVLMTAFTFLAAGLAFTRHATVGNILALNLITGVFFTVNQVTKRTFTFDIVGSDLLTSAMAVDNMAMTAGMIAGPVIIGGLFDLAPGDAMLGAAWGLLAIALLNTVACVFLFLMRPAGTQEKIPFGMSAVIRGTAAGLKVVRSSRALIGIMGVTVLFNMVYPPHRAMIPVFGELVLNVGPTAQGVLGAAPGIGSLVGVVYLAGRGGGKKQALYYCAGSILALGCLGVFAASHTFPLAFIGLAIGGIGQTFFATMQATLVLTSVEANMRGRVMGILSMAIGSQTLGSLVLGSLSDTIGPGPALLLMAACGTVATVAWVAAFREMRRL